MSYSAQAANQNGLRGARARALKEVARQAFQCVRVPKRRTTHASATTASVAIKLAGAALARELASLPPIAAPSRSAASLVGVCPGTFSPIDPGE